MSHRRTSQLLQLADLPINRLARRRPGDLFLPIRPPGSSSPADLVLARYSALDATEIAAITAFVDGLVSDGVWSKVTECYCPALNATDWQIGMVASSLLVTGAPIHSKANGLQFNNNNEYVLESRNFNAFASVNSFAGCSLKFSAPDAVTNSDYFGVADAVNEAYWRWRGTDTTDTNAVWCVTGATPRGTIAVKPDNDFVGCGLSGTTISELGNGGVIANSTRTPTAVPAGHPFQWFGQNLNGTPAVGNKIISLYALMIHMNGQTDADILATRLRVNTFLGAL